MNGLFGRSIFGWLLAVCLVSGARAQRRYELPCHASYFAASGDGTTVWAACEELRKNASGDVVPRDFRATVVYALDVGSGRVTEVVRAIGGGEIVAAPVGDQVVLVLPDAQRRDRAVLYRGTQRVCELPIAPSKFVWGSDGRRIFFYGGSTTQADAWNILGILRLPDLSISKQRLLEPTENLHVCTATGRVLTGVAWRNSKGAVEYDAETGRSRRMRFPSGSLSASCKYVATDSFFHGPVPWGIFDTATGRELAHFDLTGEGKKDEYELQAWNPRDDRLFLRVRYPAGAGQTSVEVVEVGSPRVLGTFGEGDEEVRWSSDGKWVIVARGNALVFHPAPKAE